MILYFVFIVCNLETELQIFVQAWLWMQFDPNKKEKVKRLEVRSVFCDWSVD